MIGPLLGTAARKLRSAVRKNEFGLRGITVPYLDAVRRANPRHLRLLGKTLEIVEPFWAVNDFIEIYWHQIYHFRPKREPRIIIDCGANVGLSVIYFKQIYRTSRVFAFEPDPGVFQIMERNLRKFAFEDVSAINKAIWTEESTMEFLSSGGVGGRLLPGSGGRESIQVRTTSLRPYLAERVDLLKIDIEGAELDVLRDCRSLLGNVDHLFVEVHGNPYQPQNLHELLSLLAECGFRYYVKDARDDSRPLDLAWRWNRYDIQVNVFAARD